MPNFQKSKGFQLRSGNKGGMPFKEMGSSPIQHTSVTGTRHEHREGGKKILHGPDGKVVNEAAFEASGQEELEIGVKGMGKKYADEKYKPKDTETVKEEPKKHKVQIRKQKRLDKITARREKKGKEGLTTRQINLQKDIDKTSEQFVSDRQEKARRTLAGLREYGPGGSGSQTEGKMKYDAAKLAQENTEIAQESQRIRDARTEQLIDTYDANLKKENELGSVKKSAGSEDNVNLDTTKYETTTDKVQAQIAADKALINKMSGNKTKLT